MNKRPSEISDFYERLGLPRDATTVDVETAYRALAKRYHPDMNPENSKDAEEDFKAISAARENLIRSIDDSKIAERLKGFRETFIFYEKIKREIKAGKRLFYEDENVEIRKKVSGEVEMTVK